MKNQFPGAHYFVNIYLLTFSFSLLGCNSEVVVEEKIRPVRTFTIGDSASAVGRTFPGQAKAVKEIDVAFEVGGKLIERPVSVGDLVEEGQVLARLDPRDYQNDVDAARARLEQAEAFRDRIDIAAKSNAVSQQEVTDAHARYDVARASLSIKEKALLDSTVTAPFAGSVSNTYVKNFQNVQAKQPIVRIVDTSQIEMVVQIPEQLIMYAPMLEEIRVKFDALAGREFEAEVTEIGAEASTATRTYPVTMLVKQPDDHLILPGMTGEATARRARAVGDTESGSEVPPSAIYTNAAGETHVWVLDMDAMRVSSRKVESVATTSLGIRVLGVGNGETVITAGVHYLTEGQTVTLWLDGSTLGGD